MFTLIGVYGVFERSVEVEGTDRALAAEHGAAITDKVDPGFTVEPIRLPAGDVAFQAMRFGISGKALTDRPLLLGRSTQPSRQLSRPVADVDPAVLRRRR